MAALLEPHEDLFSYMPLPVCRYIRAVFTEQIIQRQITFLVSFCIKFQNPFAYRFLSFEHCFEILNPILFDNVYIGEELRQVLCILDDGVTWTFGSWNVLFQDVLVN